MVAEVGLDQEMLLFIFMCKIKLQEAVQWIMLGSVVKSIIFCYNRNTWEMSNGYILWKDNGNYQKESKIFGLQVYLLIVDHIRSVPCSPS